jgi:hypothetical protein
MPPAYSPLNPPWPSAWTRPRAACMFLFRSFRQGGSPAVHDVFSEELEDVSPSLRGLSPERGLCAMPKERACMLQLGADAPSRPNPTSTSYLFGAARQSGGLLGRTAACDLRSAGGVAYARAVAMAPSVS